MKEHEHTETFLCGTKYWFPLNHFDRINPSVKLGLLILASKDFFVCNLLLAWCTASGVVKSKAQFLSCICARELVRKHYLLSLIFIQAILKE